MSHHKTELALRNMRELLSLGYKFKGSTNGMHMECYKPNGDRLCLGLDLTDCVALATQAIRATNKPYKSA